MGIEMDKTFNAANGLQVRRAENGGVEIGRPGYLDYTGPAATFALVEFLRAEEDEKVGRWRYPLEPSRVVYADAETVKVFDEATGGTVVYYRDDWPTNEPLEETRIARDAANAYLKAHPERPRWADAEFITWKNGAYLGQIAQRDLSRGSNLGWRVDVDGDGGRWCTEAQLASIIGEADVTVLVAEDAS